MIRFSSQKQFIQSFSFVIFMLVDTWSVLLVHDEALLLLLLFCASLFQEFDPIDMHFKKKREIVYMHDSVDKINSNSSLMATAEHKIFVADF